MASTYSTSLRLELPGTGEQAGTWGATTNGTLGTFLEAALVGAATIAIGSGATTRALTANNGAADEARNMALNVTGTLTASCLITAPAVPKLYLIYNGTTGAYVITLSTGGAGLVATLAQTAWSWVYIDGTNAVVVNATSSGGGGGATGGGTDAAFLELDVVATQSFTIGADK